MKAKVVIVASLALNIGLAAAWFHQRQTPVSTPQSETPETTVKADTKTPSRTTTKTVTSVREKQLDWTTVESADYRAYIKNLRDIACPEETVRDIIIADINKLYAPKFAALYGSPSDFKFWQTDNRSNRKDEREREEKRRALEKEKRDLIKELLGVDYESELARLSGKPDEDAWRYGFLSPEKQAQIKALSDKYREMERAIFNEGGGWSPENRAKFASLRAQREAEMAQLLSPSELEEYQLRTSWTARNMRENLGTFQPDEEEFRKIFQARKGYDDQFGFIRDGGDEKIREERRVAQQQLDEQLKAVLGPERFHDYQLSQDDHYREIYSFTEKNNLSKQMAETLYNARATIDDRRHEIERDPNLSADQRRAALLAVFADAEQTLGPVVGNQVWGQLQNEAWLKRLSDPNAGRSRDWRGRGDFRRN